MIGIINKELEAYSIIERIKEKYPLIDIYVYNKTYNDIEEIIELLKNKKCKIIILPDNKLLEIKSDIVLLSLKNRNLENAYSIENKELEEAIEKGNEKEIKKILQNMKISNEKTIILNQPKLLFIKEIIQQYFENPIVDNIEILLQEIEEIIKEKNINPNQKGKVHLIS